MYREFAAFLQRFRAFSQHCVVHFAAFRKLYIPQHDLVLRRAMFPSTTSSRFKRREKSAMNLNPIGSSYFIL